LARRKLLAKGECITPMISCVELITGASAHTNYLI